MEAPASNQTVPVYIFMLLKESGNITLLILNINRLSCYKYKVFLYKSKGKLKEYLLSSDKGFVRMFGSETTRKKARVLLHETTRAFGEKDGCFFEKHTCFLR